MDGKILEGNMANRVQALTSEEKGFSSWEDSIASDEASGAWKLETEALLDGHTLLGLFYNEPWVFISCDTIAREFSSPFPRVMKREFVKGKQVNKPAEGHPFQETLDDPTEYMDGPSFWYRAAVYHCLMGNSILWYMRSNKKYMLLPTHSTTLEFDDKGRPSKYLWIPDFVTSPSSANAAVSFKATDVVHIQRPNPASPWWGLSPFIPGRRSVLFDRYSAEFLNNFFIKGATPQVIIETEISNNVEALKTLASSFEIYNGGRGNQRRPLVLPKGAKATTVNMTLADAKLIELVAQNREVIINLLAIPKHALGLQATGSLGSEEHKTALKYMWTATIKPMLKRFAYALTKFHRPQLGDGFFIDFDTSDIEIFHDDANGKADLSQKLLSTHTINEVRAELYELEPIEGGDIILTLQKPSFYGGQPTPDTGTGQATAALPSTNESSKESDGTSVKPEKPKFSHIEKLAGGARYQEHVKATDAELARTEKTMQKLAEDTLMEQLKVALSALKESPIGKQKTNDNDLDALKARINSAMEALRKPWSSKYKDALAESVDTGYQSQLQLLFSKDAQDAVAAIGQRDAANRRDILEARGLRSFAFISETTTDKIMKVVESGVAENLTTANIAQSISDKFREIVFSRAMTIARTETLTAMTIGQQAAVNNASKIIPDLKKVWITAKDNRVRSEENSNGHSDHVSLHGDVVDANEFFVNDLGQKLKLPRDPNSGIAANVINCRCSIAMVAPEDLDQINF